MSIYPTLLQKVIMPVGEALRGMPISKYLAQLDESQWLPPNEIKQLQLEKLRQLCAYAYERVPYYRRLFDTVGLAPAEIASVADLRRLPLLTKPLIRAHAKELVPPDFPRDQLVAHASSGSTGEPLQYYSSKKSDAMLAASLRRCWQWAGYEFGRPWARVQLWHRNRWTLTQKIDSALLRCTYVGSYQFDDATIAAGINKIRAAHPEIIRGYTSAIYLMAKHMQEHGLDPIPVKAVITHSETLFPHYRALIEAQFRCRVYDTYGGEGMVIAGQCERGNYHLNDESVLVEFLRDDETPAAPEELAHIIVTNLNNDAMPFIRYRIGDMGSYQLGSCPCGRGLSLMEFIGGRDTDIIRTVDGKYVMVQFFVVFFEVEPGVEQFQVIQSQADELRIKMVVNDQFTPQDEARVRAGIQAGCGENTRLIFEYVEDIPPAPSGKRRFIISESGPQRG